MTALSRNFSLKLSDFRTNLSLFAFPIFFSKFPCFPHFAMLVWDSTWRRSAVTSVCFHQWAPVVHHAEVGRLCVECGLIKWFTEVEVSDE